IVICIAANKSAKCEHGIGVDQVRPGRRNVECPDLGALILRTDELTALCESATRAHRRSEATIVNDDAKPRRGELRVERIGRLEPGTRVLDVEVDRVCGVELIIHAIEYVFL